MMLLYKTNEIHSSSHDVYRPVGNEPQHNQYGLTGQYFVGDSEELYIVTSKPYMNEYGCFDGEPSYQVFNFQIIEGDK